MFSFRLKFSPKIIILIVLEIFLFILGNKTNLEVFFFLFLLAAVFFCLDIFFLSLSFLVLRRVSITRKTLDEVTEGDFLPVELAFRNLSFFPAINIEISDLLKPSVFGSRKKFFITSIRPGKTLVFKYGCICLKRGKYVLSPVAVRSFGFIGFLYIQRLFSAKKTVYVYPRTFDIKSTPFLASGPLPWFGLQTISAGGEEDEFFGLREYQRGDPLKRIHWFSAARKNTLIVKEFQRCSFYQATIMFLLSSRYDAGKAPESVCEYIIKIAASLTKHFIENDICIEILAHAGRIAHFSLNKGEEYLDEIFKFYAEARPESRLSLEDFFDEYSVFIPSHSTLFILLTDKEIDTLISFMQLKERNITIVALIVVSFTFLPGPFPRQKADDFRKDTISRFAGSGVRLMFFYRGINLAREFTGIK